MDNIGDNLFVMLQLQRTLNERADQDWYTKVPPFLRMAMLTAATAMEHYGCQLWSTPEPDLPEVQQDMIAILQLLLSHEMLYHGRRDDELTKIAKELESMFLVNRNMDIYTEKSFIEKMELFLAKAATHEDVVIWPVFFSALKDTGLDWKAISRIYFTNNTLKIFREDYGGNTGRYTAVWAGKEDSIHLGEIMAGMDTLDPHAIRHALVMRYSTLVGRRATDKNGKG